MEKRRHLVLHEKDDQIKALSRRTQVKLPTLCSKTKKKHKVARRHHRLTLTKNFLSARPEIIIFRTNVEVQWESVCNL